MFEYSLTIEDRVAFNLSILDANGTTARIQRQLWWLGLSACLLVLGLPVSLLLRRAIGPTTPLLLLIATGLACTLIWIVVNLVWPDLLRQWLTRRIRKSVRRSQRHKPETMTRLWLDATGVNVADDSGTSHIAWPAIGSITETPLQLLILLSPTQGFILPKRIDPPAVAEFATKLRANADGGRQHLGIPSAPTPDVTVEPVPENEAKQQEWVPPVGVVPLSAFTAGRTPPGATRRPPRIASFPTPALPVLTFAVSIDDLTAAVLDFPPRLTVRERLILRRGWQCWAFLALCAFVLVAFFGRFGAHLEAGWAVGTALATVGLLALLRWSRLDHSIKRRLPVAVEKEARALLARGGERRSVCADVTGLTVRDAVVTKHIPWSRVRMVETDRHVIVGSDVSSIAIPRRLGQPVLDVVRFARICRVS